MPKSPFPALLWWSQFTALAHIYGRTQVTPEEFLTAENQRRLGEYPQAVAWDLWRDRDPKVPAAPGGTDAA